MFNFIFANYANVVPLFLIHILEAFQLINCGFLPRRKTCSTRTMHSKMQKVISFSLHSFFGGYPPGGSVLDPKKMGEPPLKKIVGLACYYTYSGSAFFPARSLFLPKKKNFFSTFCERRRRDRGAAFNALSLSFWQRALFSSFHFHLFAPKKSRVVPFLVHCSKHPTLVAPRIHFTALFGR